MPRKGRIMEIHCHCAACGADFGVGKEFAGGSVRCVKCGEEIALPRVAKALGLPPAAAIELSADVIELLPDQPPEPEPPPLPEPSLAEVIGLDAPASTGSKVPLQSGLRFVPGKSRAKRWRGWQIGALVGGGSAAVLGIVLAIVWSSSPKPSPEPPPKPPAVLAIELPEKERKGVTLSIDAGSGAQPKELPPAGPVQYSLAPGKYRVSMDRPDFHAEDSVVLRSGETRSVTPMWVRTHFVAPSENTEPSEPAGGGETPPKGPAGAEK